MEKEYVVIVHKGVDLAAFDAELAAATGDSPIPNRSVQVADPREGSNRMTHWMLTEEEAAALQSDQRVLAVEIPPHMRDDIEFTLDAKAKRGGRFKRKGAPTASNVNWGLRRSNARTNIYFGQEDVNENLESDYVFALNGAGVDVVIQDTGIQADHPEWQDAEGNSRLQQIDWYAESGISGSQHPDHYTDTDGHGTHVAAISAGKTYGWAKGAHIYSQKVVDLGGTGGVPFGTSPSTAFDMIRLWHNSKTNGRPTIVNMSWGVRHATSLNPTSGVYRGSAWDYNGQSDSTLYSQFGIVSKYSNGNRSIPAQITAYDVEIEEMIDAGIHVCISAGNGYYKADVPSGDDYNNSVAINGNTYYYHRPASPYHEDAFFVGNVSNEPRVAGSSTDGAAQNSNRGPAVNMWAAGTNIMSAASNTVASSRSTLAYPEDPNYKIMVLDGTSQAAPQVAGVAALHLQSQPNISPAKLKRKMIADAVDDMIEDTSRNSDYVTTTGSLVGGPNKFLFSRYGVDSPFSLVSVKTAPGSGSGTGSGVDTGIDTGNDGGGLAPDPDLGVETIYGSQLGIEFISQSGEEYTIQ